MHNSQNKKKIQIVLLVLVAVLTLGIGYASITAINQIININGSVSVNQENFKVYFTSAEITAGTGTVSIDEEDATIGFFDITGLSKVGDYAEATYTVLNDSNGVGAHISLNLTNSNSEYFKVTETIDDIELQAGDSAIAKVVVTMIKTPIYDTEIAEISAELIAKPLDDNVAIGNNNNTTDMTTKAFYNDSWTTIKTNIQNNNTSMYNVGDEKELELGGESYTVRLANKRSPQECNENDFSKTACGFVIEFVDPLYEESFGENDKYSESTINEQLTNIYNEFFSEELKNIIISTKIVSERYSYVDGVVQDAIPDYDTIESNYLYLLSLPELYRLDGYIGNLYTRQLDYYENYDVFYDIISIEPYNYKYTKKNIYGYWGLRTIAIYEDEYYQLLNDGNFITIDSSLSILPAFRIG